MAIAFAMFAQTGVTGEIAKPIAAGWQLAHAPLARPACRLNGLTLATSADFTIAGSVITSPFWVAMRNPGDVLTCDYTY
jgi:hypothetical protein